MPRPTTNITAANGRWSSVYENGPPNIPAGLSYRGNPLHGNKIRITSDGSVDFGASSAFLLLAIKLDTQVSATDLEISSATIENGQQVLSCSYTNSNRIKLQSAAGMPYGVGMAMAHDATGAWGQIIAVTRSPYVKEIRYETGIYPSANQANCIANVLPGGQIKGSWTMRDADGYSSLLKTDAYTSLYNIGPTFQEPPVVASNFGYIGSVVYPQTAGTVMIDSTHCRTALLAKSTSFVFSQSSGSIHTRVVDTSFGTLSYYNSSVNIEPTITGVEPNQHNFPANIQGIYLADNAHYFIGERVILAGSFGHAEISDSAVPQTDWQATTNKTKKFAVCLPSYWTRYEIEVTLREQVFAGESLIGKYLHIFKDSAANNGEFVGSILIDGDHA